MRVSVVSEIARSRAARAPSTSPEFGQKPRPSRPVRLEAVDRGIRDRVERRQPRGWPGGATDRCRQCHPRAQGRRDPDQQFVESPDRFPIHESGPCTICVHRLDGGLRLKTAEWRTELPRPSQHPLTVVDQCHVPLGRILFVERHEHRAGPGGGPRLRQRDQRREPPRLGLDLEQLGERQREVPRLLGDRLADGRGGDQPVDGVRAVDRLEHRRESTGHLGARSALGTECPHPGCASSLGRDVAPSSWSAPRTRPRSGPRPAPSRSAA